MRKLALLSMLMAMIATVALSSDTAAQEAGGIGPGIGDVSPIISPDGSQIGTISADEIVDPVPSLPPDYEPPRGYGIAGVTVTIENTSARPFEINPNAVQIYDAEGYRTNSVFLSFEEGAGVAILEYLDALAPGTSVTGTIFVEIFSSSSVARVLYQPSFEILQTVVDLRASPAEAGVPQSISGSSGDEILQVTVVGLIDGWDGYDESYAPDRGSRYLLVQYSAVNTGDRVRSVAPNDMLAVDADGFALEPAFVAFSNPSMLPFEFLDLAPGEEQQGFVVYLVFGDIPVAQLIYSSSSDRSIVIADLGEGASAPEPDIAPPPTEVASTPECQDLLAWNDFLIEVSEPYNETLANVFPDEDGTVQGNPDEIRLAGEQLVVLSDEIMLVEPPEIALPLGRYLVDFYRTLGFNMVSLADARESGDQEDEDQTQGEITELIDEILAVDGELGQIYSDLQTTCPAEMEEMGLA